MAAEPARKLEDDAKNFNEYQLRSLENLSTVPSVDFLKQPEVIRLISSETIKDVDKVIPLHVDLFERARIAEGGGAAGTIRAFESVYGRLMLEQGPNKKADGTIEESDLEHQNSPLMQMLDKVLKFKVDPKFGLKGRSELQAVLRRLREVKASTKVGGLSVEDVLERAFGKQESPEKMMELERESAEAGHHVHEIADLHKYFSGESIKDGDKDTPKGEVKDVHKMYEAIKDSRATAAELRTKEVAVTESTKKKSKLDKLEELFAPEKASALSHLFQKFEALELEYKGKVGINAKGFVVADGTGVEFTDFDGKITSFEAQVGAKQSDLNNLANKKGRADPNDTVERKDLAEARDKLQESLNVLRAQKAIRVAAKELKDKLLEHCSGYKDALDLGAVNGLVAATDLDGIIKDLKGMNVHKAVDFDGFKKAHGKIDGWFAGTLKGIKDELKNPDFGVAAKQEVDDGKAKIEKAKALYVSLERIVKKLLEAKKLGVLLVTTPPAANETEDQKKAREEDDEKYANRLTTEMEKAFKALKKPDNAGFKVQDVADFYEYYIERFLDSDENRTSLLTKIETGKAKAEKHQKAEDKELKLAKEAAEKSKDLTDVKAARKIVEVLVAEEFPGISAADQAKIAKLVLAGDVGKLMTEKSYAEMAREGSPEVLDTVKQVGLRARLIGFRYKDGDKVVHPFDGLKPESFESWEKIKNLFDIKKLNYKNGAFLLAALEIFDEEKNEGKDDKDKVVSIQTAGVEKKLKELLAEQLGVKDRTDEAGVKKIVNDAFKAQMEKVRPLVRTHFENFGNRSKGYQDAMKYKVELLVLEVEELEFKLRKGEIDSSIFDLEMKKIFKSAEEADVMDELRKKLGLSHNTVMSKLWNNKYSQLARDKGINWGKFAGSKVGMGLLGATIGTGRGMVSAGGKLGLRTGWAGLKVARLPTALLTGIGSGFLRIFRGGHGGSWWKDVKADVARVTDPMKKWEDGLAKTSNELQVFSHVKRHAAAQWAKPKLDTSKHDERDRVKKKAAIRAERIKLLNEKAEMKILEVTESPFIDLAEFKARVEKLNKMVGEEDTKFPADTAKAGAEKKPEKEKSGESGDKPAEKKDDGAHPAPAAAHH